MYQVSRTSSLSGASTAASSMSKCLAAPHGTCPEINKETFRIFDAVDLYPHLKDLTEMKPVVVNTDISLEQLFEEFARLEDAAHRDIVREQILVKMRTASQSAQ